MNNNLNNTINNEIQELITEIERENNGTYRESLIGNFINTSRNNGLFESLILVGTNIIIQDFSQNNLNIDVYDISLNNPVNLSTYPRPNNNYNFNTTPSLNTYFNTNFNTNYENILEESFLEKSKYKNILSNEGDEQLIKTKYDKKIHKNDCCPIFQTEFDNETDVIELPCKHIFTPNAIKKWLKEENAICPICRFKLKSTEVKIDESIDLSYQTQPFFSNNRSMLDRFLYIIEEQDRHLEEEEQLQQSIINSILNN
jgi:hypothetical protein